MKFFVLMEDRAKKDGFVCEHGFSLLVTTEKHTLLVDAGATQKTFSNAALFGVAPSMIDTVILTHGHYDHGGGLPFFAKENPAAPIYVGRGADGDFFSERDGRDEYIGLDRSLFLLPQIKTVEGNIRIDEELSVFYDVSGAYPLPPANARLKKRVNGALVPDDFSHERYAVIEEKGRRALVSGCAHRGLPNILRSFEMLYGGSPDILVSGFHTGRKQAFQEEDRAYTEDLADCLEKTETVFFTGHCTGSEAFSVLEKRLPERIFDICAGDGFTF